MTNSILVSIIIPVYNVKEYLDDCLYTVLNQSYSNIEVILIDDGSSDGSSELCDYYASQDNRITVVHKKNQGVSMARNDAIILSNGEYIFFVDSDDWIELNTIENILNTFTKTDSDVVFFSMKPELEFLKPTINNIYEKDNIKEVLPEIALDNLFDPKYSTMPGNKAVKRSIILQDSKPLLFSNKYLCGEDEVWLIEIIKNSKKVCLIDSVYYHWRERLGSATHTKSIGEIQYTELLAQEKSIELINGLNCPYAMSCIRENLCRYTFNHYLHAYIQHNKVYMNKLHPFYTKYRRLWYKQKGIPAIHKLKRIIIDFLLLFKIHGSIIYYIQYKPKRRS